MNKYRLSWLIALIIVMTSIVCYANDGLRTNVGYSIGYAEKFDQSVDKAKLTAILSLLPDAKRNIYLKLGLAASGYSDKDIAALALGSIKITSLDVSSIVGTTITVSIIAETNSDRYDVLKNDNRLMAADRKLLDDIKQALAESDRLNRDYITVTGTGKTELDKALSANQLVVKRQYALLDTFWDLAANNNDDALRTLNGIVAVDKTDSYALLWRGVANYYLDNYDAAIVDLNTAGRNGAFPDDVGYYLGNCEYMKNNFTAAIAAYTEAIAVGKPDAKEYYYRANCYRNLKMYDLAIIDYSKTISIDSNLTNAYTYRGNCYFYGAKYDEAAKDYDVVITAQKADGYLYFNRGTIYMLKGDVDNAINCFDQTTKLLPSYADGYYNKATALYQKLYLIKNNKSSGDPSKIITQTVEAYKKFITLAEPNRPEVAKAQKRIKDLTVTTVLDI
ncbi:MAG: tetratricopeptide repeat protein [Negativicutes bacterium]|jgi:tetratricopeptide (TPR) repeat protein